MKYSQSLKDVKYLRNVGSYFDGMRILLNLNKLIKKKKITIKMQRPRMLLKKNRKKENSNYNMVNKEKWNSS